MRIELQAELDALEAGFQETGEIVVRSVRGVIDALRTQDDELCDEVIAFDDEVDERYLALERQVEMVLARQTPVATDLRLVLAVLLAVGVLLGESNTAGAQLGNDALNILAVEVLVVFLIILVIEVHGDADDPQSSARNLVVLVNQRLGGGIDSCHGDAELVTLAGERRMPYY